MPIRPRITGLLLALASARSALRRTPPPVPVPPRASPPVNTPPTPSPPQSSPAPHSTKHTPAPNTPRSPSASRSSNPTPTPNTSTPRSDLASRRPLPGVYKAQTPPPPNFIPVKIDPKIDPPPSTMMALDRNTWTKENVEHTRKSIKANPMYQIPMTRESVISFTATELKTLLNYYKPFWRRYSWIQIGSFVWLCMVVLHLTVSILRDEEGLNGEERDKKRRVLEGKSFPEEEARLLLVAMTHR